MACRVGLGLNIAHEAVDRHAEGARIAIIWPFDGWAKTALELDLTYADLRERTDPICQRTFPAGREKRRSGVHPDRKITRAIYRCYRRMEAACRFFAPLFSAFGPEPIYQRLQKGNAKVLVTTTRLYRQRVADLRERLPQLKHVLLTDAEKDLRRRCLVAAPMHGAGIRHVCDPAHRSGGHGDFAFYQRHHGNAQGSRSCARSGSYPLHDR